MYMYGIYKIVYIISNNINIINYRSVITVSLTNQLSKLIIFYLNIIQTYKILLYKH